MQTELDLVETNIIGDFRLLHDHHVRIALASGETHSQSWPLRDIRCRRRRRRRGHVNVDVMNSCNGPVGTGGNDASPRLVLVVVLVLVQVQANSSLESKESLLQRFLF